MLGFVLNLSPVSTLWTSSLNQASESSECENLFAFIDVEFVTHRYPGAYRGVKTIGWRRIQVI